MRREVAVGRWRWAAGIVGAIGIGLGGWALVHRLTLPAPPPSSPAAMAHAANVRILRDGFGVPHVFGRSDADAAFGLAWAHAEDDWPLIQGVLAASRGQLGVIVPGQAALANDTYARLVDVDGEITRDWPGVDPHVRAVFDGYAEGLNHYAALHPNEADGRLLPLTGADIARGFVHKLPLMMGVDKVLKALGDGVDRPVGTDVFPGSNAHAIAPWRSADGVARLVVNSHQPWEGPVAWYEATIHSEEGWDMAGATFPGAPLILHGHNAHVGWALTVNRFDRSDVYAVELDGDRMRWDGGWEDLVTERFSLPIGTPWGVLRIPQTLRRSRHGFLFERGARPYAVRSPAAGQGVRAAAQWLAMNKARSGEELLAALGDLAIPMFNVVWADREHIGFVYNGRIPMRTPGFDYEGVLPGDDPRALWTDVLPFAALPQVRDPASGFVQACNSAPWVATLGPEAPDARQWPDEAGIEEVRTNRTRRTLERLADGAPLSRQDVLDLKWDRGLASDAPLRTRLLGPIASWTPPDPLSAELKEALLAWDGRWDEGSVGAGVALLAWRPLTGPGDDVAPGWTLDQGLAFARDHLRAHHGGRPVPLGVLQRLRRGDVDLPVGGGPDVLNCVYVHQDGPVFVGDQGDSYVMVVDFAPDGARSESVHQYGSSSRPGSPHFADQAPLFVQRELKPVLRTEAEIRRFLEAEYHPGEPWEPRPQSDAFTRLLEARAAVDAP